MTDDVAARAASADAGAWAEIYEQFADSIYGYLFNRLRNREAAEDLTGTTFVEAIQAASSFKGDLQGLKAWLFRIARHNLIDHRRREGRVSLQPLDESDEAGRLPAADDVEEAAIAALDRRRLHEAVEQLSEDQRDVVMLRLAGGLSSIEIAEITGKSPGAVKQLQHRALRSLSRMMADPGLG